MAIEPLDEKAQKPQEVMPRTTVVNVPMPTKEEGQRAINITDLFITRWTPPWSRPPSLPAYTWRAWVLNQPVATICKEILIAMLTGLDWNITSRDAKLKEDLAPTIRYYQKLLYHGGYYLGSDFTALLEWVVGDMLDIPFGGAVEIGHKNDSPEGRVMWLRPLDGGTLYPTLNKAYPVVQYYQGYTAVPFPAYSIARAIFNPRPEIFREGWGMAPPEKIYFAMDLLTRGDKYYANLLMDIPPAGILDLGDMEKSAAQDWIDSFRNFIANTIDSFKIPVLYEHNNEVKFLPFGKNPNDIMYDHITMRYAAIVAAAYGLQLNDIGLQTTSRSGETLAGSIRSSRQTRKTGIARLKMKTKFFLEQILPPTLQFDWVDYDDELNVAMGRARLASATAFGQLIQAGAISPQEARSQMLFDGLISISVPEALPPDAQPTPQKPQERPGLLGHGVPASMGGEGEVKSLVTLSKTSETKLRGLVNSVLPEVTPKILETLSTISDDDLILSRSLVSDSLAEDKDTIQKMLSKYLSQKPIFSLPMKSFEDRFKTIYESENLFLNPEKKKDFEERFKNGLNGIAVKAILDTVSDVLWTSQLENLEKLQPGLGEEGFDTPNSVEYDYIQEQVQARVLNNLPATLYSYAVQIVNEMEKE